MVQRDLPCFLRLTVVAHLHLFSVRDTICLVGIHAPSGKQESPCTHALPRFWLLFDACLRLVVAKKLSRAVALSAGEGEERGMRRAAAAAGLEWDGDVGQR